jgi:hypothetical protein
MAIAADSAPCGRSPHGRLRELDDTAGGVRSCRRDSVDAVGDDHGAADHDDGDDAHDAAEDHPRDHGDHGAARNDAPNDPHPGRAAGSERSGRVRLL